MASLGLPMSIAEITKDAVTFQYDPNVPLLNWLRSADSMHKQAQVYEAEGNDDRAYALLYRRANLVLQDLANHPQRNIPENKRLLAAANATVLKDLAKLETLKPRIEKRYEEYQARRRAQQEALEALEGRGARTHSVHELDGITLHQPDLRRQSLYDRTPLEAADNRSLAARLAQREVWRRDNLRRSTRQPGAEHSRPAGGMWVDWEKEMQRESGEVDNDLSSRLQEVVRLQQAHGAPNFSRPTSIQPTSTYHYPSIPHKTAQERWSGSDIRTPSQGTAPARPPKELIHRQLDSAPLPPPRPPKPPTSAPLFENPRPPPIPRKVLDTVPSGPPVPGKYIDSPATSSRPESPFTDTDKFEKAFFKPSAFLENGEPLRTIFLPAQLRHQFLIAASKNTRLNLETCGILCGMLKSNALFITHLLIPEQTSTSDTCETVNEQDYFDYCDKEDIMVLGWIHTHPTQTCFMSSRDLHTHVGYQVMMPESIAIVCAPTKQPSWGCFRLTDPPGKQTILNCTKPGIFHPHDVDNIYTEALKPGHVVEIDKSPLNVIDMRSKK